MRINRRDLKAHQQQCDYRTIACTFHGCGRTVQASQMVQHRQECQDVVVLCPLKGCTYEAGRPLSSLPPFVLSFFLSFSLFPFLKKSNDDSDEGACACACLHFPVRRALHFPCMLTATISTTMVHQRPTECYARNTRPSYRESGIDGRALEVAGDTSGRVGKVRKKRRGKKKNTQPHRHYSNR